MRTQASVEELIRRLYQELGGKPEDLLQIKPIDGGWDNALSYEITRKDRKHSTVYRKDLDDGNKQNIKSSLSAFS